MRAVLDTNVIVSGILSPSGAAGAALDAARHGRFDFVISPVLVEELREVLERYMDPPPAVEIGRAVEEVADIVEPSDVPMVSRDRDDDQVLAAAVAGAVAVLVTRDEDLLVLSNHQGIGILAPADFLQMLRDSR